MIKKLGGRKIFLGLMVIAIGIVVDYTLGLSDNLLTLLMYTGVGFFLGNGIEHMAGAVRNKKIPGVAQEEVQQALAIYSQHLSTVDSKIHNILESVELTNKAVSAIIERVNK